MKKRILAWLLLGIFLGGCGFSQQEAERLFQPDTVVNIPLQPEETEAPTEAAPPTEAEPAEETEPETQPETVPPETKAPASGKTSSGKSTGSKSSGSKKTESKPEATQPPETEPPTEAPTEPPETEPEVFDISGYSPGSFEYAVAEQINAYRADAGLEPLSVSTRLCGIAAARAWEICASWSHTRPDGRGWKTVLSDYGYGYSAASEQLAHTSGYDAASIVGRWMESEGSSAELLNPAYTTVGVGVYTANGSVFLAAILIG